MGLPPFVTVLEAKPFIGAMVELDIVLGWESLRCSSCFDISAWGGLSGLSPSPSVCDVSPDDSGMAIVEELGMVDCVVVVNAESRWVS